MSLNPFHDDAQTSVADNTARSTIEIARQQIQRVQVAVRELQSLQVQVEKLQREQGLTDTTVLSFRTLNGVTGGANSHPVLLSPVSFTAPVDGTLDIDLVSALLEENVSTGTFGIGIMLQSQIDSGVWRNEAEGGHSWTVTANPDFFAISGTWRDLPVTAGTHTLSIRLEIGNNPVSITSRGEGFVTARFTLAS